jgi:hypothetical protein
MSSDPRDVVAQGDSVAIGDTASDWRQRPVLTVAEFLAIMPLSERSARRALEPGGDLANLAVRVGRRVFVRTASLTELLSPAPQGDSQP